MFYFVHAWCQYNKLAAVQTQIFAFSLWVTNEDQKFLPKVGKICSSLHLLRCSLNKTLPVKGMVPFIFIQQ